MSPAPRELLGARWVGGSEDIRDLAELAELLKTMGLWILNISGRNGDDGERWGGSSDSYIIVSLIHNGGRRSLTIIQMYSIHFISFLILSIWSLISLIQQCRSSLFCVQRVQYRTYRAYGWYNTPKVLQYIQLRTTHTTEGTQDTQGAHRRTSTTTIILPTIKGWFLRL